MVGSPGTHLVQYGAEAVALVREGVLYTRRNLGIDSPFQNAGILELLQPLGQGPGADTSERTA